MLKLPVREQWRQYVPVLLIVIGSVLLLYVGAEYARMFLEQRRLTREWRQQQHRLPGTPAEQRENALVRLLIPKINLDAIVVEGTSRRDLLLGPGHIKSTTAPGDAGNVVITGHRDTFFRHLHELTKGDLVRLERGGKTYVYQVTGTRVVDAEDVSVLHSSKDSRLTLITCYPTYYNGPAPDRFVVFSRMLPAAEPVSMGKTAQLSQETK